MSSRKDHTGRRMCITVGSKPKRLDFLRATVTKHYFTRSSSRQTETQMVNLKFDDGTVREGVKLDSLEFMWIEYNLDLFRKPWVEERQPKCESIRTYGMRLDSSHDT